MHAAPKSSLSLNAELLTVLLMDRCLLTVLSSAQNLTSVHLFTCVSPGTHTYKVAVSTVFVVVCFNPTKTQLFL